MMDNKKRTYSFSDVFMLSLATITISYFLVIKPLRTYINIIKIDYRIAHNQIVTGCAKFAGRGYRPRYGETLYIYIDGKREDIYAILYSMHKVKKNFPIEKKNKSLIAFFLFLEKENPSCHKIRYLEIKTLGKKEFYIYDIDEFNF